MLSPTSRTVALLIFAYVLWSTGFVTIKVAFGYMPIIYVMAVRMLPAGLLYLFLWKKVRPARWHKEDFKWLALMPLLDPVVLIFFQGNALPRATASQIGMIFAVGPLLMAIAAWLFFKERISRRCVLGIVTALSGVLLVALTGKASATGPQPVLGSLSALCAVCCAISYAMCVKRLSKRYSVYTLLAVQAIGSGLVHLPFVLLTPFPQNVPPAIWAGLIYVGIFPACLGYIFFNRALASIKAAHVSLLNTLMPVFILIIGHVVLGERLFWPQYVGSALVLCGALVAGMPERSSTKSVAA